MDEPDILWGMSDGLIYDLIFDNVVIGNETIENTRGFRRYGLLSEFFLLWFFYLVFFKKDHLNFSKNPYEFFQKNHMNLF